MPVDAFVGWPVLRCRHSILHVEEIKARCWEPPPFPLHLLPVAEAGEDVLRPDRKLPLCTELEGSASPGAGAEGPMLHLHLGPCTEAAPRPELLK